MTETERFSGEVKVASRIVDFLSSGLYKSPGSCLKELVNNSYDADATLVHLLVKPDADCIIVEDDGSGMDRADFVRHFDRVAESHKRDASERTPSGRPQIGRIGIGFIAANEICDEMEIYSTKRGSPDLLHVRINFDAMRDDLDDRRRGDTDVVKGDYEGQIETAAKDDHYTRIFLNRVRAGARNILISAQRAAELRPRSDSLYGLTAEQVHDRLADPKLESWEDFDLYSQTMLEIALNVPVPYHQDWLPRRHKTAAGWFETEAESSQFTVRYDGTELRKPVVLRPGEHNQDLFHTFEIHSDEVHAHCYLYAKRRALRPDQLNGVLLRIRGAAVGEYDRGFLGFPNTQERLIQDWISAEIWASDELEDAMNIDRRTLRDAHPAYVALRAAFYEEFGSFLKQARERLYKRASERRRVAKADEQMESLRETVREPSRGIPARVAQDVMKSWKDYDQNQAVLRRLVRKYSVTEIYAAVLDAAAEVLDPDQLQEFLRALTIRLRK